MTNPNIGTVLLIIAGTFVGLSLILIAAGCLTGLWYLIMHLLQKLKDDKFNDNYEIMNDPMTDQLDTDDSMSHEMTEIIVDN